MTCESLEVPEGQNPDAVLLSAKEVASITGLSKAYLDKARSFNSPDSPPWFRIGRRCVYSRDRLQGWIDDRIAAASGGAR